MATRWRRRRITRRLSGLCEAGEALAVFERLGLGGWWVLSDRALYVVTRQRAVERIALAEIQSVRVSPGSSTIQVTVMSAGDAVIGDLHADSEIARRLRALPPAPAGGPS